MAKRLLAAVLVLSVCLILAGTAYSIETKSVMNQEDYSPFTKAADITLESIRNNECMDEETKIKSTIVLLLQLKNDQICNWELSDYDFGKFYNLASENYTNLLYSSAKTKLYKEIWKHNSVEVLWSSTNVTFGSVELSSDSAKVDAYSSLQFVNSSYENGVSSIGVRYHFSLIQNDGIWLVDDITTDDDCEDIVSYDEVIAWILEIENGAQKLANNSIPIRGIKEEGSLDRYDPYWTLHYLNTTSSAQYALAYSSNYAGVNYNSNFYDYSYDGGDCTNFASQCIWYGLGGINTSSMIGDHRYWPMVDLGTNNSRNWYQDGTDFNFDEAGAWGRVVALYNYLMAGGPYTVGPFGTEYSGISYAKKGDLIQVDMNNDQIYDHTYVVTSVTGATGSRTSDDIFVCSHTPDMNNVQFTTVYSTSKTYRTIHIGGSWEFTEPW